MRNERYSLHLEEPQVDSSTQRDISRLKDVPEVISLARKPVSLWGSRSPDVTKRREARLWALFLGILRKDPTEITSALTATPTKPQQAPDEVSSLMRLSPELVPDHPIKYAMKLAHEFPPMDLQYLYQLLAHRNEVGQMTPNPDSDEEIINFIASLKDPALAALMDFVLQNEPDESAAPAA